MPVSNYTVRIDEELRRDATELFAKMGLTLPAAINAFLRQSVSEQRMPFTMGALETPSSCEKQLPDGIEWPRWDDGTLFDPREIGSRKIIDRYGDKWRAHKLAYDGGLWLLLADDSNRPVMMVDSHISKSFPRSMFEGWRPECAKSLKCTLGVEEIQMIEQGISRYVAKYNDYRKLCSETLGGRENPSLIETLSVEKTLIGTPERKELDAAGDYLLGCIKSLDDEQVKCLDAIISLGESENLKSFSAARSFVWDFGDCDHDEAAEGCYQTIMENPDCLEAGIGKMKRTDWK